MLQQPRTLELVRKDARELQTMPPPRAIPKTNRAPMGKHVGPGLQACVRDATSCKQLGSADESFNQAIRLGPSSGALNKHAAPPDLEVRVDRCSLAETTACVERGPEQARGASPTEVSTAPRTARRAASAAVAEGYPE
jgi:hypothetical protein